MVLRQRFSTALTLAALLTVLVAVSQPAYSVLRTLSVYQHPQTISRVQLPRPGERTDRLIERLQLRLRERPSDQRTYVELGTAYLQKARETGDPGFYAKAEDMLAKAFELQPDDPEAMTAMGTLALARHQFQQALEWGQRALAVNPSRAAIYGVLGDALVELGRYDEAVAAVQHMVDLRPDLASYSRVAYLRELHGDVEGAIEAMQMAVQAGAPGSEGTAWTQVQLGHLYLTQARLHEAEAAYAAVLRSSPNYMPALAGLGRVRAAQGHYDEAAKLLRRASDALPLPEYVILLGDIYAASGNGEAAAQQYALVRAIDRLQRANGVDTDLEMALFHADHGVDLEGALARARAQYGRRPSIHAADVLAWTLHQNGACEEGQAYAREALRLGTRDALMHYHAGMLALCAGDHLAARTHLEQALAINPSFSIRYAPATRRALADITDGRL
jgi:tetratricopeptide (TPR) repeat protein